VRENGRRIQAGPERPRRPFVCSATLEWPGSGEHEAISEGRSGESAWRLRDLLAWLEPASLLRSGSGGGPPSDGRGHQRGTTIFREAIALRGALRTSVERLTADNPLRRMRWPQSIGCWRAARPTASWCGGAPDWSAARSPVEETALPPAGAGAESAGWLLEHGDRTLLRRCGNPRCILYFYDTTRMTRRRWCSMARCGSRAKAAAYYLRNRRIGG